MKSFDDDVILKTEQLTKSDVKVSRKTWDNFSRFALTFNPSLENLTDEELSAVGEKVPNTRHSTKVLRAYLYNWQRILNNRTYEPDAGLLAKAYEVMSWINDRLPDEPRQ